MPATGPVWAWPADDAVAEAPPLNLVRVPAVHGTGLWTVADLHAGWPPATLAHPVFEGQAALLLRARFLTCRHLGVAHAPVRPLLVQHARAHAFCVADVQPPVIDTPQRVHMARLGAFAQDPSMPAIGATAQHAIAMSIIDMMFGGIGLPEAWLIDGVCCMPATPPSAMPFAVTPQHWASLFESARLPAGRIAEVQACALAWADDAAGVQARILGDARHHAPGGDIDLAVRALARQTGAALTALGGCFPAAG